MKLFYQLKFNYRSKRKGKIPQTQHILNIQLNTNKVFSKFEYKKTSFLKAHDPSALDWRKITINVNNLKTNYFSKELLPYLDSID